MFVIGDGSVPDGGWRSWLVVLASFLVNCQLGVFAAIGVLLPAISAELGVGSGSAGQIPAILLLVRLFYSPTKTKLKGAELSYPKVFKISLHVIFCVSLFSQESSGE